MIRIRKDGLVMASIETLRDFYRGITDEHIITKVIFSEVKTNYDGFYHIYDLLANVDFEPWSYIFEKDVEELIRENIDFSEEVFEKANQFVR